MVLMEKRQGGLRDVLTDGLDMREIVLELDVVLLQILFPGGGPLARCSGENDLVEAAPQDCAWTGFRCDGDRAGWANLCIIVHGTGFFFG
jgi:hypothetical protein